MTPPPPYALPCWADDRAFYIQLPGPSGPVTIAFPDASRAVPYLRQHFAATPRPVAIPARVETPHSEIARACLRRVGVMG